MENIEVLKLVKRKHNDSYRPVLDLSLVNDIKNYSWWGENDFLYQLFMALIESEILNLLKGVNNKNKVKYRFCTAEVFDNLISIKRYSRLNLEMPIEEFFEFYDEYNRLIKEKAHEIVLRKCEDKISAEGIWYLEDSPFNKKSGKRLLKIKRDNNSDWYEVEVEKCLNIVVDYDDYDRELGPLYDVISYFGPFFNINIESHETVDYLTKYYQYVKINYIDLIGERIFGSNVYNLELRTDNKIIIHDMIQDIYFFEMDIDNFFNVYIQYLELKEQDPLPDEILFIKENEKIRVEGIWYKDKENKKEQNYIKS